MAEKIKLLIRISGGYITEILSTSPNVEITVDDEDEDTDGNIGSPYFQSPPDKIITQSDYDNCIEEIENDQLNKEDEEGD